MKFEVSTTLLQTICNKAVKAVSTKDLIPSLKNFLIDVTEQNIHIIAGDSATYIEKDIPCNTISSIGKTSIDARDFTKLIGKINSDTVLLELKNNKLEIKAGKSKFSLKTIDAAEYVYPETLNLDVSEIKISLAQLKTALKMGAITLSKNATEVYFTGYKLGTNIMTTNRNNLTIYDYPLCGDDLLITTDIVNLINDLDGETIEFGYTSDFIEFKTDGTRILGNLLCGLENFPPNDVLDNFNYDKIASVLKKDILPVLDRALIFVKNLGAVELIFKNCMIESKLVGNSEVDTYEEIPYHGDLQIAIKVNVGMLAEICTALETDVIELHLDSPESPLLIKSGAYCVLMASMAVE
jgi:DNA polymerase-3 subunit beta